MTGTYLGVALDDFAGDMVGLESLLQFHAFGVDAGAEQGRGRALVTPPVAKLNWKTFSSTGPETSARRRRR
jgi:hypothetical protein